MNHETLLLVDDEEGIRRFLGLCLLDLGYEVITAANGSEALEQFSLHRPAIVLTDIKMPVMDGIELLKRIKELSPDTEVVIITGHGDLDLAIEALKSDAADFITKPINNDVLEISLNRIREKISMKQALREYTEELERLVEEKTRRIVELERQTAAAQVVERLSTALSSAASEVEEGAGLFNELPCLVSVHTRNLEIVACNTLFKQRLGDCRDRRSYEIYADRDPDSEDCPVRLAFATGRGQRSRETLRAADGTLLPVTVFTAPLPGQDGTPEMVLDISVDMTELSRLKQELLTTQMKYQHLFDEAPCYITVQNADYSIAEANRRFKETFGDAVGRPCYAAKKHRDAPCEECLMRQTLDDGLTHQKEGVVTTCSGEQKNVLVVSSPIRDSSGEVIQVIEMYTDITEIRRLQDHLTSLGIMLGSMSHGVKGMLTALDGGIYRIESGLHKEDQEQVETALGSLKDITRRIKKLVLDILYYAKSRELETQRLEAAAFLRETAALVEPKAAEAGVALRCDIPQDLGQLEADGSALSAAIVNFLENAVDACEDAGDREFAIDLLARREDDTLLLEIADNGKGMDRETSEKVFTLFFSSKGKKGTGLGLFISNQTIEQHGGSIEVASTPGEGTTFSITLPANQPETAAKAAPCGGLDARLSHDA